MKVHHKFFLSTPIIIVLSLLSIGAIQLTALWGLTRAIYHSLTEAESSSIVEVQPALYAPQFYGLEIVSDRIRLVSQVIYTSATSPEVALQEALIQLFSQSSDTELITTIPKSVRLLNLHIEDRDIYIDLSREFGFGGGSSSMIYRVAQVLYTATSIDPEASVFLSIEEQPLNENYPLGGEGLLLDYPLNRQNFEQHFAFE